ncbi:MAG: glycine oxidase ThiO [Brevibacillus sp.]|nr:glycine oxidase ThiO [Brevibacillus sp.]
MDRAVTSDCLVIGGGIIGLSLAYELAGRGLSVTVLEQGDWGGQASVAAAGILGPLQEFDQPGPLFDLGLASLALYPEWVAELREVTGIDPQLVLDGILRVAMDEREQAAFWERYGWQQAKGCQVQWLENSQLKRMEPNLSGDAKAAIYSPAEGHVNSRMLLKALTAACQIRGVRLESGVVATAPVLRGQRVIGVESSVGMYQAEHTIIAAGAWTGLIGRWLSLTLPIRPVRGQVAAVSSEEIPLKRVIFGTNGYIVPKKDGRVIVGATEDEAGFRLGVTLAGLARVLQGVRLYVPALGQAAFLDAWSGLRPATADGLPLLGPLPGWEGIAVASGHFRNGILLSPVTAKRMADYLTQNDLEPLRPFLPARFCEE